MKRPNGFPPPPPEPEAPSAATPPKSVRPIRSAKAASGAAKAGPGASKATSGTAVSASGAAKATSGTPKTAPGASKPTPGATTPTPAPTGRFTIGGALPGVRTTPITPEPGQTPSATEKATPAKTTPAKATRAKTTSAKTTTAPPTSPSRTRSDEALARKNVRATERERRRYERAEARRFTERTRRRRLFWLVSAGIVVALVLLVVFTAYSPLFAVRTVDIEGTSRIDAAQVESALSDQVGKPLALVDYTAVNRDLAAFTLIQSYAVESELPNTLVIRIVERQPVGSVTSGAGFDLVDAAGVVIEHSDQRPTGYPQIDTAAAAVGTPGFLAATAVLRDLPAELLGKVDTVSAATPDSVTLVLTSAGQKVIWGSVDDSALKAVVLDKLVAAQPDASTYDVSSPDTPIVS